MGQDAVTVRGVYHLGIRDLRGGVALSACDQPRQGIESGLKRFQERLSHDEAAQNMYEKVKQNYESEINPAG